MPLATGMVATPAPAPARRSKPKLGDVVRDVLPELWGANWLGRHQKEVLDRLASCGTERAGLLETVCADCGALSWRALGCQDRHCPSCGAQRTEKWVQARLSELLDVPYFSLTFGIHSELYPLFRINQRELYGLLFAVVRDTLHAFAADPAHLGGTPAFLAILHTANRQLGYHPHLHVEMAGAAYDEARDKLLLPADPGQLFPVDALTDAFRDRLLRGIRQLDAKGLLTWRHPNLEHLADQASRSRFLAALAERPWKSVWCQPATRGPEHQLRYLARHVHRTAITNARLAAYVDGKVTYAWDDRQTRQRRHRTLPVLEFLRRFAHHILPKRFQRVRSYGLLSPAKRQTVLPRAQRAARQHDRRKRWNQAVMGALGPETMPQACCEACGSLALRPYALIRGSTYTRLQPQTLPTPPPDEPTPRRREVS